MAKGKTRDVHVAKGTTRESRDTRPNKRQPLSVMMPPGYHVNRLKCLRQLYTNVCMSVRLVAILHVSWHNGGHCAIIGRVCVDGGEHCVIHSSIQSFFASVLSFVTSFRHFITSSSPALFIPVVLPVLMVNSSGTQVMDCPCSLFVVLVVVVLSPTVLSGALGGSP